MTQPGADRAAAFREARRHSARVRFLKQALPATALAVLVAFASYSWLITPSKISVDVASSGLVDGKLIMASPKLDGYTKNNLPYAMTASRAIQDPQDMDHFDLENIVARLPINLKTVADVTAASGTYDNKTRQLVIDSPMSIVTSDGLKANLQGARIDVDNSSLSTDRPVDIRLDGSQITADSMQVKEKGAVLVFDQKVRMTLMPAELRERQDAANKEKE